MNLPSLFQRNGNRPFRSLARLQEDFDKFLSDFSGDESRLFSEGYNPSCELSEDKANYYMNFDIPGTKKEDVKVEIDGNQLSVSAERREEKKSEDKKSRYSEISYGSFHRSFTLPMSVDKNKVDATFEHGVLKLTMPKTEQSQVKQIKIQ